VPLIEDMRTYGREWLCGDLDIDSDAEELTASTQRSEREPAVAAA